MLCLLFAFVYFGGQNYTLDQNKNEESYFTDFIEHICIVVQFFFFWLFE